MFVTLLFLLTLRQMTSGKHKNNIHLSYKLKPVPKPFLVMQELKLLRYEEFQLFQ